VDNVILRRSLMPTIEGTLCITGHHLILSSRKEEAQELWVNFNKCYPFYNYIYQTYRDFMFYN